MPKRKSTTTMQTRIQRLVGALEREDAGLSVMVANPATSERARVRFTAQANIVSDAITHLNEMSLEPEPTLKGLLTDMLTTATAERVRLADAIWMIQQGITGEEEAGRDYSEIVAEAPQLWAITAEHTQFQRLEKQIQDVLKAHEEGRE